MIQIIPAINAVTWDEAVRKIRAVESYADWLHLDVADGTFTPNTLWHDPSDLAGLETKCNIEIHLMADRPGERVPAWLLPVVKRLIVHAEVTDDLGSIRGVCLPQGIQVGLAVDSRTPWTALLPHAGAADLLQILAVPAGMGGQEFQRHNLGKIKDLRARLPGAIIEADGGMTPPLAAECAKAGADIIVAGSYIFDHPSPGEAIRELQMANG